MKGSFLLLGLVTACDEPHRAPANWPGTSTTSTSGDTSSSSSSSSDPQPACTASKGTAGVEQRRIEALGKQRTYTLVVPSGYAPPTRLPLIFVLHGHSGSGAQARKAFDLESVAGNAIFVYPDGIGGGWDLDSPTGKNPDVALFDSILALTNLSHCVDLRRVFVAGFSNGGYMANQLACRRGDRIRAVASHSSGGPYETTGGQYDAQGRLVCNGKPVASLVLHGMSDGTVAPSEGQKSIDHFVQANHCSGSDDAKPCATYKGCGSNTVMACRIPHLGHGIWPQAKQTIWTFFDGQR